MKKIAICSKAKLLSGKDGIILQFCKSEFIEDSRILTPASGPVSCDIACHVPAGKLHCSQRKGQIAFQYYYTNSFDLIDSSERVAEAPRCPQTTLWEMLLQRRPHASFPTDVYKYVHHGIIYSQKNPNLNVYKQQNGYIVVYS